MIPKSPFFILVVLIQFPQTEVLQQDRYKRQSEPAPDDSPLVFPPLSELPEDRCVAYDGGAGRCRPVTLCVFRFESVRDLEESSCTVGGEAGVCCPGKPPPSRANGPTRPESLSPVPDITATDLDFAGQEGRSMVQRIEQLEAELQRRGLVVKRNSPEHFLGIQFDGDKNRVRTMGKDGLTGVEATLKLIKTFQLSSVGGKDSLRRLSFVNTVIGDTCPKSPPCHATKYRTSDGSCNNLKHPKWGKAFHTYSRVLPPRYADGINEARAAYDSGPLPSAREVSQRVISTEDKASRKITVAFTIWAQFLAYDLSLTGVTTAGTEDGIVCCHPEIQASPRLLHPACLPIHVPDNDPYFRRHKVSCMHFLRSAAAPRSDCTFGPREQLNQVTAYIDVSNVYGSSEQATKSLRKFEGGKLKWSSGENESMMRRNISAPCNNKGSPCLVTGDSRSNQNVLLSLLHELVVREHNGLADRLSNLNPGWNDEILFHESRRLVCAILQHITYSEFLPLLLGKRVMSAYGLPLKLSGYSFDYDTDLNTDIINTFATAANRYGHSLSQSESEIYTPQGHRRYLDMRRSFDTSILFTKGIFDAFIQGIVKQPAQAFDNHVSRPLTENLFNNTGPGLDLVALNIQRGRDHGIPGYNEWREYCGLPRLRNFEELTTVVDPDVARNMSRLYRNVDDVDLYPAGIAENPLPDAVLGPTFACLVAEQFRRLKLGDRFWYENGGKDSSFYEAQLQEIRKVTLSRFLCDNSNLESAQLAAFVKPNERNPTFDCEDDRLPTMSLNAWKNEPVWS